MIRSTCAHGVGLFLGVIAPTASYAQQLGAAPPLELPLLRIALGLFLCIALSLAIALAFKHRRRDATGQKPSSLRDLLHLAPRRVHVIETHRLSPNADACVLRYGSREYLIVTSPAGATVIREQDAAALDAPA